MLTGDNPRPKVAELLRVPVGLVHGDLHAENILCDGHNLFLIDFAASGDQHVLADIIRLEVNVAILFKDAVSITPVAFRELLTACMREWIDEPDSGAATPSHHDAQNVESVTSEPEPEPELTIEQTSSNANTKVQYAQSLLRRLGEHRRDIIKHVCATLGDVKLDAIVMQETLQRYKLLRDAVLMWWLPPPQRLLALLLAGHTAQKLTRFHDANT
jgi:hypothetical protein